jgi:hypothetical protein
MCRYKSRMLFPSHLNLLANSCYHQFDSFSKLPFIMSQPSVSQCTEGSPYKRVRVDKKQFIGPSYIRMQPISFAIPLSKLRCDFINPDDETSVARGARTIMDTLYGTVSKKGLAMQSRRYSSWGKMGGAVSSPLPVFISLCLYHHLPLMLQSFRVMCPSGLRCFQPFLYKNFLYAVAFFAAAVRCRELGHT